MSIVGSESVARTFQQAGFALAHAAALVEDGTPMLPIAVFTHDGQRESVRLGADVPRGLYDEAYRIVAERMDPGSHGALVIQTSDRLHDGERAALVVHVVGADGALAGTISQVIRPGRRSFIPGRSTNFAVVGTPLPSPELDTDDVKQALFAGVLTHPEGRRLFPEIGAWADTTFGPIARAKGGRSTGNEALPEGVYTSEGDRMHYVGEGSARPLCGRSGANMWRWSSAWFVVDPKDRCRRCDALVGDRGTVAHGLPTEADMILFGIEPSVVMSPDRRDEYKRQHESLVRHKAAEPPPPTDASAFEDPPFVLLEDPAVNRRRNLTSMPNRVLNDVYIRNRSGKKWHRIYAVSPPHRAEPGSRMADYGRGFIFPCGGAASEFEPEGGWVFRSLTLRSEVPAPDEICMACKRSDAKYGKGPIDSTTRWDR